MGQIVQNGSNWSKLVLYYSWHLCESETALVLTQTISGHRIGPNRNLLGPKWVKLAKVGIIL